MQGPATSLSALIQQADHLSILRHIRAHKLSNTSSLVVKHGQSLLQSKIWSTTLNDIERLASLEQICAAALEENNLEFAKELLEKIQNEVVIVSNDDSSSSNSKPTISLRYRKLLALSLECEGEYDKAFTFYDQMIRENPANSFAYKRRYCILKSQGKTKEAREALNSYLEVNGMDAGAWVEMANSCMELGDYGGAAYCYEEIVLSSPMDSKVHCILGELYATIGGMDNLKLARKHLAMSLELDPKNLRAVYSIVSAAETYLQLAESNKEDNKNKKKKYNNDYDEEDIEMAKDLYQYGVGKLSKSYKGSFMGKLLELVLDEE